MLPSFDEIRMAAARIAPAIVKTPLLRNDALDERLGARVFIKAESLQRFGAFKLRGAYNALAALGPQARARGVLAFSSGNHAIAVAAAARLFACPAVIVMPADAPRAKLDKTRALGAEIVTYDRLNESREDIGARLAAERGLPIVKPFDDPFVMAGQGTIALELSEQLAAETLTPDIVLPPASGGGLAGGIAIGLQGRAKVYAVEPAGHDDIARSLAAGRIERNAPGVRSICDALLVEQMSERTFAAAQKHLAGALAVTDAEVVAAVRFAFHEFKLVLEPSGAAALAALLAAKLDIRGQTAVAIASGANVDADAFTAILQDALPQSPEGAIAPPQSS